MLSLFLVSIHFFANAPSSFTSLLQLGHQHLWALRIRRQNGENFLSKIKAPSPLT
jgi:hypothetical protein